MSAAHAERLQKQLQELLKVEGNKFCADCGEKAPRWASWSLGVFLCMECAGLHRRMGVHISKVKSVSLDTWNDEQVEMMRQFGNKRSNEIYLAYLPKPFVKPTDMEEFIRRKYEKKEWHISNDAHGSFASSIGTKSDLKPIKGSPADVYASQLSQLEAMGFKNRNYNLVALERAKGDLARAVDDIVANDVPPDHSQSAAYQEAVRQFKGMGFTNESLIYSALDRAKGDPALALEIIIANQPKSPPPPAQEAPNPMASASFPPPPSSLSSSASSSAGRPVTSNASAWTTTSNGNASTKGLNADLVSLDDNTSNSGRQAGAGSSTIFSGDPWSGSPLAAPAIPAPAAVAPAAPVAPKPTKEDILSLYNKPVAPMAPGYGAAPSPYAPAPMYAPNPYGAAVVNPYAAVNPYAYGGAPNPMAHASALAPTNPFGAYAAPTVPSPHAYGAPHMGVSAANPFGAAAIPPQAASNPFSSPNAAAGTNPFLNPLHR